MPRVPRIVVPRLPHYVTQVGNNHQDVFFADDDRRMYLTLLREQAGRFGLRVHAYCLMTNHVHLTVTPRSPSSLAQAIGRTHLLYARYINRRRRRSGHLWQNRFYSCALDDLHYWRAACYVERNPVRARMVRLAWSYAWSSARAHVGGPDAAGLLDLADWRAAMTAGRWKRELQRREDEALVLKLRSRLRTGRPLVSDSLLSRLERRLGRRLRAAPVGRPRKRRREKR